VDLFKINSPKKQSCLRSSRYASKKGKAIYQPPAALFLFLPPGAAAQRRSDFAKAAFLFLFCAGGRMP
jgi:hypothetical protein